MRKVGLLLTLVALASPALATETVKFSYDPRGRLVKVERTGTVNNGVTTDYGLDKADNRLTKATTGSANPGPP